MVVACLTFWGLLIGIARLVESRRGWAFPLFGGLLTYLGFIVWSAPI